VSQQIAVQTQGGGGARGRIPAPVKLLVLVAGMLLFPAGASAAGWLPPVNISAVPSAPPPADVASIQDVALDGQGNAVAIWVQADVVEPEILRAATRPAGGAWGDYAVITQTGGVLAPPKVVVSPDGDAAAIWLGESADGEVLRAATRPAEGEWSEPVELSDVERIAREPDVAIDVQGNLTAIWREDDGVSEEGIVEAATRPAGGEWSEPVGLSDDSLVAVSPQLAVDPDGNVTAAWVLNTASRDDGIVQSKTRPADGAWSAEAVDVSGENGLASVPRIAVDAEGDATAVWQQQDIAAPSGFRRFVQTAERVDGTWSEPLSLSREDGLGQNPELTVDPEGNATAIWSLTVPLSTEPRLLQGRSRTPDGSWGEPFSLVSKTSGLSEPGELDYQLQADPQGNVTAAWTAWAGSTFVTRSAHFAAGVGWSVPVTISVASGYSIWPRLAVDPQGHATVLWSEFRGSTHAVRSRVLDPVAPELDDLVVPETGVVGQPVAMSVDPFDVWSPVTTSWDFGDGDTGTGAAVSHCFSTPGERTVTVTGTDLVANATSESRTIEIEPDPGLAAGTDPCSDPDPPDDPGPPTDPRGRPDPDPKPGLSAPVVSGLRQSHPRWHTPGTRGRSRLPVGTTFRFALDRPAQVRFAFSRIAPGRPDRPRGILEMAGTAGPNAHGFRGKISGRTLRPGRYRLLVTALADGITSAPASIEFRIVR
jgi:hypothetical protein